MRTWLKRLRANPKTSVLGLIKGAGGVWYFASHWQHMTPEQLMHPERGGVAAIALGFILAAISDLVSADAKDEIQASEVRSDTTLVGEK
jgi:hypothetical protein